MKNLLTISIFSLLAAFFFCGCAVKSPQPQPLAYLALEKPKGVIDAKEHKALNDEFFRGGWYFGNYNFRPSADIKAYIEQGEKEANTKVLKNADLKLNVPFAFDILFFGYNGGRDYLTSK